MSKPNGRVPDSTEASSPMDIIKTEEPEISSQSVPEKKTSLSVFSNKIAGSSWSKNAFTEFQAIEKKEEGKEVDLKSLKSISLSLSLLASELSQDSREIAPAIEQSKPLPNDQSNRHSCLNLGNGSPNFYSAPDKEARNNLSSSSAESSDRELDLDDEFPNNGLFNCE